jgi:hypothetical protein
MKRFLIVAALISVGSSWAVAQNSNGLYGGNTLGGSGYGTGSNSSSHYVSPYTTSRGTEVQGHYQTNPNTTQRDNYGARGNVNPYTGAVGTRSPQY